jgi:NADH-quinone oxidoreductase subunit G
LRARTGEGDKFLLSADRNPNTNGAKLTGATAEPVGGRIPVIAEAIKSGKVKTLIVHGENIVKHGIAEDLLRKLDLLVASTPCPTR